MDHVHLVEYAPGKYVPTDPAPDAMRHQHRVRLPTGRVLVTGPMIGHYPSHGHRVDLPANPVTSDVVDGEAFKLYLYNPFSAEDALGLQGAFGDLGGWRDHLIERIGAAERAAIQAGIEGAQCTVGIMRTPCRDVIAGAQEGDQARVEAAVTGFEQEVQRQIAERRATGAGTGVGLMWPLLLGGLLVGAWVVFR